MVEITVPLILDVIRTIGILVAILYYFTIMRNAQRNQKQQLETRQAQLFYGIYNRMSQSDFAEAWNAFLSWEYSNMDESRKITEDKKNRRYWAMLGFFFSGLGVLVRLDLVPIHYVANFLPHVTRTYYEKQAPIIREAREKLNDPQRHDEVEFLYNELMKYLGVHPELKT